MQGRTLRLISRLLFAAVAVAAVVFALLRGFLRGHYDNQVTDFRVRAELAEVFESDPAYRRLSLSSVHLKVVNITVRGSLSTRADLERLRSHITEACPALGECVLHWDVSLRDTGERVDGLDQYLFQDSAAGAATAPGRSRVRRN